jgi:uncharacterized membrane protein YbhN (UPF0104 family)
VTKRWTRRWRWPARVLAGAGSALALWLVFRKLDLGALVAALATTHWFWYLAGQGMFATGLLAAGLRWHLMLRLNHEAVVHGGASVRMVFISQFFNTVFGGPSGGDVPKTAVYSRWFGVSAADVLAASVLDRLVSSVGGLLFAATAVAWVRGWVRSISCDAGSGMRRAVGLGHAVWGWCCWAGVCWSGGCGGPNRSWADPWVP